MHKCNLRPDLRIIILITLFYFLCGCTNDSKNSDVKRQFDGLAKSQLIDSLARINNITYLWDTLHYAYSISYEEVISSDMQIISDPIIQDVYIEDSLTYIRIEFGILPSFIFDLKVENKSELLKYVRTHRSIMYTQPVILLVDVESVNKELRGFTYFNDLNKLNNLNGQGRLLSIYPY
jgi:hypothetical protein